jgi:hypothetical protein
MAMSVLSGSPARLFGRAQLLAQMQQVFEQRASRRAQGIKVGYDQQINSVDLEANRWRTVRTGVREATDVLSKALGRIRGIRNNIDTMIRNVNKAEQREPDGAGPEVYAASFDSLLRGLDQLAADTSYSPNLLGVARQSLTYRVGINGSTATVASAYVGSDYYIVDSESKYWDLDRTARILKRYDEFPDHPTSTAGNLATGLSLDSLSGTDITFTVGPDTASPETFSGTLHRKGLEILDAWGYDQFATADGRQRALDDLNQAKLAVDLEIRRYEVAMTSAKFYENLTNGAIKGFQKETNDLILQQAIDIQKAQEELARQFRSAIGSVARSISLQNEYAAMLNPAISGKFARSLLNILA